MDVRNSSKERKVFWEAYQACGEENGVRPDGSPFYLNWANDFANFLPEKSLQDRSRNGHPASVSMKWYNIIEKGLKRQDT
jgi:hypothetical protein